MWVSKDCFNHTSYKSLARKRFKCHRWSKKSHANYHEIWPINDLSANSKEADQLLEKVCNVCANEKHKKIPQVYCLRKTKTYSSAQTKNNVEIDVENYEKETTFLSFVQPDFYQVFFLWYQISERNNFLKKMITSVMLK